MTLDDYATKIHDAQQLTDLAERKAALYLTAEEISRIAWRYPYQARARDLVALARSACGEIQANWVDGFESLVRSGHTRHG